MVTLKYAKTNDRIRAEKIRLIGENGEQAGIVELEQGLKMAQEAGCDLVEIAPTAKPPVCRIMDYSKFKYEQQKRERQAKKKQHIVHLKEIRLKPKIEEHDYQVKLHKLEKFLEKGDRAKVALFFRGREITHKELGMRVIKRLIDDLKDRAEVEKGPISEKRSILVVFVPKKKG